MYVRIFFDHLGDRRGVPHRVDDCFGIVLAGTGSKLGYLFLEAGERGILLSDGRDRKPTLYLYKVQHRLFRSWHLCTRVPKVGAVDGPVARNLIVFFIHIIKTFTSCM